MRHIGLIGDTAAEIAEEDSCLQGTNDIFQANAKEIIKTKWVVKKCIKVIMTLSAVDN